MKIKALFICIGMIGTLSCDPEPTGPETNCNLLPVYELDYHFLKASRVFDVRTNPPTEIVNGTLEYDLGYQWVFLHDDVPVPYPYSEYFIDSIEFVNQSLVDVNIYQSNLGQTYDFVRNDCQLDLESPEGKLHLELSHSGDEIAETRFAIYNHSMPRPNRDTFLFVEFRLGPSASYEEIIKQFALENPGQYDTIAIEQVENRTRE